MAADLYELLEDDSKKGASILVRVHVQPRAGRTLVGGRHGDALKVKVAAPPVQDRANQECVAALAHLFGVSASQVDVVSGAKSRVKRLKVTGVELGEAKQRLKMAVSEGDESPGPQDRTARR